MRWHIIVVGKPRLEYARSGMEEYLARLKPFAPTELHTVRSAGSGTEGSVLLEKSKTMFRVVLDERGEHLGSRQLSRKLCEWEMHGKRDAALLIGGADGHT